MRLDKWLKNAIGWTMEEVIAGLAAGRVSVHASGSDSRNESELSIEQLIFGSDIVQVDGVPRAPWHPAQVHFPETSMRVF